MTMLGWGLAISPAWAQSPPAAPDDTPSIRVGATIFADYTYTTSPEATDSDGNSYNPSTFNVGRTYINVTGNISHLVSFRVTPDIARELGAGSSLNGSLTFRLKYGYAQFALDDWMTTGSWARLGIQQTPWIDVEEGIYRYRFQGTVFAEREGYLSSSDAGVSFHYNLPANIADVHVGIYDGENYNRAEVNDRKAVEIRGSVRPFAQSTTTWLKGLRLHGFYDADSYVRDGERRRALFSATFEHARLNAGFDYLDTGDQPSVNVARIDGHGYSVWATPRTPIGWEGLLRFDHMKPNDEVDATRSRTILGLAYWFPHQGMVSTALMFDYDSQTFDSAQAPPRQERLAVHALVNF